MYLCSSCNYASATQIGKCPDCGSFGTFEKDTTKGVRGSKAKKHTISSGASLQGISRHQEGEKRDRAIGSPELMRILPKGIKQAGIYLLAGEPGIGKSTIMLQIINELQTNNTISIGYFSGEETAEQILERQDRILNSHQNQNKTTDVPPVKGVDSSEQREDLSGGFAIYYTTHLEDIITTATEQGHDFIIIDSIQTIYSESIDGIAGSPSQVKYCSEKLSEFAKSSQTSTFIVGHVTKGGEIAGPKYLEHIVDMVLYLEGERFGQYRFLRCRKNRFGSTDEVGIFEMGLFGLQPVYDLKERIINQANVTIPGNVLTVGIDNGRPVLINLEVLLNKTYGTYPQRVAQGVDPKRLQIICAILDRYLKLGLSNFDIYVNIPGEFYFRDTGLDLALAAAIWSQAKNKIIDKQLVFIGELGLGGQVLSAKLHKKRSNEVKDFDIIDKERIKHISELVNVL